jgi:hypothetical protein
LRRKHNKLPVGAALAALVLATAAPLPAVAAAAISYSALVMTNNPIAYWQLNDTQDPSTGTAVVHDSSTNGLNGVYATAAQNGFNGIAGPRPPDFPGFPADNWAMETISNVPDSYATVPLGNLGVNAVTFTAWVNPNGSQLNWAGLLMDRSGSDQGGVDMGGTNQSSSGMLAYVWNDNTTWTFASGLTIPLNQWSFVAVAIAPAEATLYLDYLTNGITTFLSATNAIPEGADAFGTGDWQIGADLCCGDGAGTFNGSMAQVAVFGRTLSGGDIAALFAAGLGTRQFVPPSISQPPASVTVYAGRSVSFSAAAGGTPPPSYQWQAGVAASGPFTNVVNSAAIAGATTASLTLGNVTAADALNYRIVANNVAGAATSTVATVTVLVPPTLGPYANAVYTNGPLAYWRLNENSNQTNALDFMGDLMGTYGSAALWGLDSSSGPIHGPIPPAFPGFETNNTAVETTGDGINPSWVTVPTPVLTTNTVTFLAWIYPTVTQADYAGLFMTRGSTQAGIDLTNAGQLGYIWNDDSTWTFQSGLVPPLNQWSMVAVVIEPAMATLYLCTGGTVTNAFNLIPQDVEFWGGPAEIGCDGGNLGSSFQGAIDQVALFEKALSFDQIDSLYGVALDEFHVVAPWFVVQPTSNALYAGLTATFQGLATGSSFSYQWLQGNQLLADGTDLSGSKTATLTLSNIAAANAGNYTLVASNSSGSVTSSVAALTVEPRTSAAYEAAVLSLNPLAYWRLNETNDPSSGTVIAYDYVGGYNGTYGTNAQNGFNGIAGPRPTNGFAIFEADNFALGVTAGEDTSCVTAPQPTLNTNTVTFTLWVYPDGTQADWTGLFMNRSGDGEGVDMGGAGESSSGMLAYIWNDNSTWDFASGLTIPLNQWSFVAVTIAPTQAILYLINANGVQRATNAIPQSAEAWGGAASIGIDPGYGNSRDLNGIIDEVALFDYTLTPSQVQNLYAGIVQLPRPALSIAPAAGGKLAISWNGPGTLQSTPAFQASQTVWTNVETNNPAILTPTGKAEFYRVLLP